MKQLEDVLEEALNWELADLTLSSPKKAGDIQKIKVRPVIIKDRLIFQAAQYTKTQVFHKNIEEDQMKEWLTDLIQNEFKQTQIKSGDREYTILSGKKGNVTVKERKNRSCKKADKTSLEHNRKKTYILPEGTPVPFLIDLGVMTSEGKIVRSKYDKYRQINRFLEFIQDILEELPKDRPVTIIDFGCGKSYLTFAMYYYLCIQKGYPVKMIGLDLKTEVIKHCSQLRDKYGYENLEFIHGDIADFEGTDAVDMVVTLHACDTATDYAIWNAIAWKADMIFSVPCCQHEVNQQLRGGSSAITRYGLLKERFAALMTDSIRGCLLESQGYHVQLLEFIDMAHSPKNVLIRGIRGTVSDGKRREALRQAEAAIDEYQVSPALYRLLMESKERDGWNNGT